MILLPFLKEKKLALFGLGISGLASLKALLASNATVFAWDDKASARNLVESSDHFSSYLAQNQLFLHIPDVYPWQDIDYLVVSPGIASTHPIIDLAQKNNCPVLSDIDLLYMHAPDAFYVGITGTNGKSTTTALLGHIFKEGGKHAEVGGNIGKAALSLEPHNLCYILELSSFQIDLLHHFHCNIAIFLNFSPDHLDRYGSMEKYVDSKKRLYDFLGPQDYALIGMDDIYTVSFYKKLKEKNTIKKIIPISSEQRFKGGVSVIDNILYNDIDSYCENTQGVALPLFASLPGKHNAQNIAAAFAAAYLSSIRSHTIMKALKNFEGLPHRMEYVTQIRNILCINDSKATNQVCTANSLQHYKNIHWIAGGKPKEGGISTLTSYLSSVVHVYLIGEAQDEFAKTLEGKIAYTKCNILADACKHALNNALSSPQEHGVILLSPSCASYDQWPNFEARGEAFKNIMLDFAKNYSIKNVG